MCSSRLQIRSLLSDDHLRIRQSLRRPVDYFFLHAESFYNVATYTDEVGYLGGYEGKSLHSRSHGEAFLTVLNHKLRGHGLYLFDEPGAALSPSRQMTALASMHSLVEDGPEFIIATHSPILLAYPRCKMYYLTPTEYARMIAYRWLQL